MKLMQYTPEPKDYGMHLANKSRKKIKYYQKNKNTKKY